MFITVHCFLN